MRDSKHNFICDYYKAYRKANTELSMKEAYDFAKWSYEHYLNDVNVFVPYIPKIPSQAEHLK